MTTLLVFLSHRACKNAFAGPQLRVFLSALVKARTTSPGRSGTLRRRLREQPAYPEEVLPSTIAVCLMRNSPGFALRLPLIRHTDTPRENDFDFLGHAEAVFVRRNQRKSKRETASRSRQGGEAFREKAVPPKKIIRYLDPIGSR
jgi:hypothetical protein